jgi:hypothetical protein
VNRFRREQPWAWSGKDMLAADAASRRWILLLSRRARKVTEEDTRSKRQRVARNVNLEKGMVMNRKKAV